MINIQTVMLVALGFFVAALIALLVAPAYRRRAARLTTEAMKRSMPLTEAEIRADRDRLRAEYAISIHRLEAKVAEGNTSAARQRIELNRRDAAISDLETSVATLKARLEEHENARRVLEQTLTDRLPKIEGRLTDAKKMLMQRDREITALSQNADKQSRALEETTQINTQQRNEIERLNSALATRAARNRENVADSRFDSEVALRSEIDALRAKNRDQASHIARLQGLVSRRHIEDADFASLEARSADLAGMPALSAAPEPTDMERLRAALRETEVALRAAQARADAPSGDSAAESELRALRATNEDQATEIARLKAAVASYHSAEGDDGKESRLAMKAQLTALKVQSDEQASTIQRLRAEIATANERLARQAQHFRDELRRMGAGTMPAAPPAEVPRAPAETTAGRRSSLAARISEPRSPRDAGDGATAAEHKPSTFLKALEGGSPLVKAANGSDAPAESAPVVPAVVVRPSAVPAAVASPVNSAAVISAPVIPTPVVPAAVASVAAVPSAPPVAQGPSAEVVVPAAVPPTPAAAPATPTGVVAKPVEAPRRPRLMERLAGTDKS